MPTPKTPPGLSVAEYAEAAGLARGTVLTQLNSGAIDGRKTKRVWRVLSPPPPRTDDVGGADLHSLRAKKLAAETRLINARTQEEQDKTVEAAYDNLVEAARWVVEPLKKALANCGLSPVQRRRVGVAFSQVRQRLAKRWPTARP